MGNTPTQCVLDRFIVLASAATLLLAASSTASARTASRQQEQTPILFGTVSGEWTWEPAPIPGTPGNIRAPELVRRQIPSFPTPDTVRNGYQGHVIVEATIDLSGKVIEPTIVRTPAPAIFDDAVLAAVRQWSFRPAMRGGLPTEVTGIFTFHFAATYSPSASQDQREPSEQVGRRANAVAVGSEGLVAPRQISTELPEYTDSARAAGVEGDVYIEAVVTTEGTVVQPELIRGLADEELNRRALEAVTRWRFEPGTKDNEPVDVIALFTVTYRIQ